MAQTTSYSMSDIAEHKTKNDIWIIVGDKVYDVTHYLDDHPGGEELLLDVGGQDATALFEDAGHSDDARETKEKFLVGNFSEYQPPPLKATYISKPIPSLRKREVARGLVGSLVMLLGGSLGAFAAYKGLLREALAMIWNRRVLSTSRPFWQGFITSFAASAILAAAIGHEFQKTLHLIEDMSIYPAHRKPRLHIRQPKRKEEVETGVLDTREYKHFPLLKKQQLSHNVYRFSFGLPRSSDTLGLLVGQHLVIRAKISDGFVERSYTPTSGNSDLGRIELTVKVYPNGKIGNYLLALPLDSPVAIKARPCRFQNQPRSEHIGCIAGGSGITPIYQLVRTICEDPQSQTEITLLYANQVEEDILMREEMEGYAKAFPAKFKMHYVLDHPPKDWKGETGFVTQSMIEKHLQLPRGNCRYLVCGPPPMVAAMKKHLAGIGCTVPLGQSQATDQVFIF